LFEKITFLEKIIHMIGVASYYQCDFIYRSQVIECDSLITFNFTIVNFTAVDYICDEWFLIWTIKKKVYFTFSSNFSFKHITPSLHNMFTHRELSKDLKCKSNCGFFGASEHNGYCSKCYNIKKKNGMYAVFGET
jgi:hypothetical protein